MTAVVHTMGARGSCRAALEGCTSAKRGDVVIKIRVNKETCYVCSNCVVKIKEIISK
jgi:hypothetical protein